jgi:hypothetical protein
VELVKLTREELYERVWAEPMKNLAPHYGLSDVGLAKTCKRLRVPVPGRGYWAKKAAGHPVKMKPLPPLPMNPSLSDREVTLGYHAEPTHVSERPNALRKQKQFEFAPENLVVVPDTLRSPHPLIRRTEQILKQSGKSTFKQFLYNYQESYLDVEVTRDLLPRALRIMDALLKAFEERGWKVSLSSKRKEQDRNTYVNVLGQDIPFGIREKLKKVATHATSSWEAKSKDEPSGRLALVFRNSWGHGVDKSFDETPTSKLEDRLNEFIFATFARAYTEIESAAYWEDAERIRAVESKRLAEIARRKEEEAARVQHFQRQAAKWTESQTLLSFVAAVRDAVGLTARPKAEQWLAWAERHALSLNPIPSLAAKLTEPDGET